MKSTIKKNKLYLLNSKGFVFSLILLILNDFYFKSHYHNWITGKLSDFTGLFVFAIFFIAFFSIRKNIVLILTAILFIFWKSEFSTSIINHFNNLHIITIGRVVDYSDYLALLILPLVYYYVNNFKENRVQKAPVVIFSMIAIFAMTATSYRKSYTYDKLYSFDFGKEELVLRMNKIKSNCQNYSLSLNINNADSIMQVIGGKKAVHISGYSQFDDTMYKYKRGERDGIDTIYHYRNAIVDTIYISDTMAIEINIPVRKYITKSTTGYCDCLPFTVMIKGDKLHSSIYLKDVYISNCMGMFENNDELLEKIELQKAFESELTDKLK
jgi:hypothetical protein